MKKIIFKLLLLIVLPFLILQWSQVHLPIWVEPEKDQIKVYINNKLFKIGNEIQARFFKSQNISYQVILKDGDDMYYKWSYPHQEQKWQEKNGRIILLNPREFDVRFISEDHQFMISVYGYPTLTPYENISISLTKNGEEIDKKPYVTSFSNKQKIKNIVRLILKNYFAALLIVFISHFLSKLPLRFSFKKTFFFNLKKKLKHLPIFLVLTLSFVSFITALLVHYRILENMPHSKEEVLYLFQAKVFSQGKIFAQSHPLKEFFDFEYMINDGKWYSKEPPGTSLLFVLGEFVDHPEIVNPLLFALTVFFTFLLGKALFGKIEGLLASLFIACSPTLILFGANFMAEMPSLFFRTVFMLSFLYFIKNWSIKWAIIGGSLAGFASLIRPYDTLFFLIPFALFLAINFSKSLTRKKFEATLILLSTLFVFGLLYLSYNKILTGNPFKFTQMVYSKYDYPGFGMRGVEWPIKFGVEEALKNLYFNLLSTAKVIWGWPEYLSFSFIFIAFFFNFKNKYNWLLLGTSLSNIVAYFFYHHHGNIYGPRYFVGGFTAMSLLTAVGFVSLINIFKKNQKAYGLLMVVTTAIFFTYLSFLFNKIYLPKYKGFNWMNKELLIKAEKTVAKPALVFIPGDGGWSSYGQFFWKHGPDLSAEVVYALDESDYHLTPYHPEWQRKKWKNSDLLPYFPNRNYYKLERTFFKPL